MTGPPLETIESLLVTLPVPSVVMLMPLVPDAVALIATEPLEPDEVCKTRLLAVIVFEVVIVPFAVRVIVPPALTLLDVPMLAEAPVVVIERSLLMEQKSTVTAPVLEIYAELEPALKCRAEIKEAAVKMGVPIDPMLPLPEYKEMLFAVMVTAPERVIVPEPLASSPTLPVAVLAEMLALTAIEELFPLVARLTFAAPDMDIAPLTVSVPPELTVTELVVPEIGPRVVVDDAPLVFMVRDLEPSVIVCPDEVKAPPLLNCKLYAPAGPAPETSTVPLTVKPPELLVVPTINVPAVIADKSELPIVMVPAPPATVIDLLPFGSIVTVPEGALTNPENETSLAVIDTEPNEVAEIVVEPALVTLPVPFVLIVVLNPPPRLAFTVTAPLLVVVSETVPADPTVTADDTVVVPALVI